MTRAMDEVVRLVPAELSEASYSLGATRLETAFKVVVRQALPGVVTAVLIALGRGIGDAASVIFMRASPMISLVPFFGRQLRCHWPSSFSSARRFPRSETELMLQR